MRVLIWHVHGSWTTSFLRGGHDYLLPVTPTRDADGRGRALTWDWPATAVEVPVDKLAEADVDVVVLQRPHELELVERWTGRRPGRDLPAVYVEHNTPGGAVPFTRHPLADRSDVPVVHVTHFNRLLWDCGDAPTDVVEHGVVDPGRRWTGSIARAAVAVNDPVRRGRAVGTDLLPLLASCGGVDVFGMRVEALDIPGVRTFEDLPQEAMHTELAQRRVYVHTARWTSLGLSLIEAMHLGMPVVALATTEVPAAVPPEAGVVTSDLDELADAVRRLLAEPDLAATMGAAARSAALARYGLGRFLSDWDDRLSALVPASV